MRRELGQQPFGGLLPGGDQLRLDAERADRVSGGLADTGDLDAAEVPGVQPVLGELLPDRPDGVHRGEDHPGVPAVDQALDRPLHLGRGARRLDRDRRHLARDRPVRAQPGTHRAGLLLGPGDEHLPAVQRPVLPPAQLVPLADALADGEHHPAGKAERRRDERVDGRRGRVLGVPGAVAGHPDAGGAVDPGGEQAVTDRGQVAGVHGERERAPADGRGQRVEVQRGDVLDVGGGADARQRHARVRGDTLRLADARDHLEVRGGTRDRLHLLDHRVVAERVTGDQVHRVLSGAGGRDQHLRHVSRHTLRRGELGVGPGLGTDGVEQRLGDSPVVHHLVGVHQGVVRPAGQQARVAGTSPDERDAADGLTGAGHSVLPNCWVLGPACPSRPRIESAPRSRSSAASALPISAASAGVPVRDSRRSREPSGLITAPRR